jgi:hypothetical protein
VAGRGRSRSFASGGLAGAWLLAFWVKGWRVAGGEEGRSL